MRSNICLKNTDATGKHFRSKLTWQGKDQWIAF